MKFLLLIFLSLLLLLPKSIVCMETDEHSLCDTQFTIHQLQEALEQTKNLLDERNKKLQHAKIRIAELELENIKLKFFEYSSGLTNNQS